MLAPWKKSYDQPRHHIIKQRHYIVNKGLSSQGYGFSSGHVWMWELDYKESWTLKNWCFWTVVLEKTLESPLDYKEIQWVYPKGDQSWVFIGRTDAEAETPVLWPPDAKSWLIWKDPDWCWERLRAGGEGDVRGWDGWMASPTQWTWVWVDSGSWWWIRRPSLLWFMGSQKESDMTEWLNWTQVNKLYPSNYTPNMYKHTFCCFSFFQVWFPMYFLFFFLHVLSLWICIYFIQHPGGTCQIHKFLVSF